MNTTARIILTLLFLVVTGISSITADVTTPPVEIAIQDVEALPGDTVSVPVIVNRFKNISTLRFTIQFSSGVLLLNEPPVSNVHAGLGAIAYNTLENTLVVNWYAPAGPVTLPNDAQLFVISFLYCDQTEHCAAENGFSPVNFIEPSFLTSFQNGTPVPVDANFLSGSVFCDPPLHLLSLSIHGDEGDLLVNGLPYSGPVAGFAGDTFLLEALPADNNQFLYWQIEDETYTDNPLNHILLKNDHLVAYFTGNLYTVAFEISDMHGDLIHNAVVQFNGTSNPAGDYVFHEIMPGWYSYSVNKVCYLVANGEIQVVDEDILEFVSLLILPGDVNGDGSITTADIVTMVNFLSGTTPPTFCFDNADLNGDGVISVADIVMLVNLLLSGK